MDVADFDFPLPKSLIAQRPAPERSGSRLLVLEGDSIRHCRFDAVRGLLGKDDLLVVNDTRVVKARLQARKDSGGRVELLVERIEAETQALCQARASQPLREGRQLALQRPSAQSPPTVLRRQHSASDGTERRGCEAEETVLVVGREGEFYRLRFASPVADVLQRFGQLPLPPYIERAADAADEKRYQTVYAAVPGAVAAPTAGLHFDAALLARLEAQGVAIARVTLHVGAGTFQPLRVADPRQHRMHAERYSISAETRRALSECRGRVVAVGTTVVRTLEAAAASGCDAGETRLFVLPGFRFRAVDVLITNFHLPKSTLLMLVSAFAGSERVRRAYREAVEHGYRFFSYGDAMFCERAHGGQG